MKKILCLLVALLLVGSLGLAEAIDLSSMTDEELLALKEQVDCAINERGISAAPHLLSGVYTAGSDITPGKYVIHVPSGQSSGYIYVYENKEKLEKNEIAYEHYIVYDTEQDFYISLEESNVLSIDGLKGYATISKVEKVI
jgi:hypothetical protein